MRGWPLAEKTKNVSCRQGIAGLYGSYMMDTMPHGNEMTLLGIVVNSYAGEEQEIKNWGGCGRGSNR